MGRVVRRALLTSALAVLVLAAPASARPVIATATCWPATTCASGPGLVTPGGQVRVAGTGVGPGARLVFVGDRSTRADDREAPALPDGVGGLIATVPAGAPTGLIALRTGGTWSNGVGPLTVVGAPTPRRATPPAPSPFDGAGMWIWYVSRSGGSATRIASYARAHGISVVYVKGADGTARWGQLSRAFVARLHAAGLRVCAWQYTYGRRPEAEARVAAAATRAAQADCFVIDAEVEYEGHYAAARRYLETLRRGLGATFALGVAGWPYADYHPGYPLSVFLGPRGATANIPQVYWRTIGDSVDEAVAHTWRTNAPYGRSLYPLGQTSGRPPAAELDRFRGLVETLGARGASWWSWQATAPTAWRSFTVPSPLAQAPVPAPSALRRGSRGDIVVWLQEHLRPSRRSLPIDGRFGPRTAAALRAFQLVRALPVTGQTDAATWAALTAVTPYVPRWGARRPTRRGGARVARAWSSVPAAPRSASMPARRFEIRSVGRR
jgi:Putative peptidoglycan binding domain